MENNIYNSFYPVEDKLPNDFFNDFDDSVFVLWRERGIKDSKDRKLFFGLCEFYDGGFCKEDLIYASDPEVVAWAFLPGMVSENELYKLWESWEGGEY